VGAWGSGHFENDDASDWAWSLEADDDASAIRDALKAAARPSNEKVDAIKASCALAAASVVAAAIGRPTRDQLPEEAETWVAAHATKVGDDLVALARAAVDRVKQDSELRDLWNEAGPTEWLERVDGLQSSLPAETPPRRGKRAAAKRADTEAAKDTESVVPSLRTYLSIGSRYRSDAASIGDVIAGMADGGRVMMDFETAPLRDEVVGATVGALAERPDLELTVVGGESLEWVAGIPHLRKLRLFAHGLDVSPLGELHELRELSLGVGPVSLAFLSGTPLLETLDVDHAQDFDAVAGLAHFRSLDIMHPSITSLDFLAEHPTLEGLAISWPAGDVRDLAPIGTIPELRVLTLNDFPHVSTSGFAGIGDCPSLTWLRISHFPDVADFAALVRAQKLRFLELYGMSGLTSLTHLGSCARLEEVRLRESRPADQRLAGVAAAPALTYLEVDDEYPETEIDAAVAAFRGRCFDYRRRFLVGSRRTGGVFARAAAIGASSNTFHLSVLDAEQPSA
jgi:hypothetical protein